MPARRSPMGKLVTVHYFNEFLLDTVEQLDSQRPNHTILLHISQSKTKHIELKLEGQLEHRGDEMLAAVSFDALRSLCRQFEEFESA